MLNLLLTGIAQMVYTRMKPGEQKDNRQVRTNLLEFYDVTRDNFWGKLDEVPEKPGRQGFCLEKVISIFLNSGLLNVIQLDVFSLLVMETDIKIMPSALAEWVKDQDLTSLMEAAHKADKHSVWRILAWTGSDMATVQTSGSHDN